MDLKEFFKPLFEGPRDAAFKPAPEIKPSDDVDVDPIAPDMGAEEPLSQDVNPMSSSDLQFFSKNVTSAAGKYNLEQDGFDPAALQEFAGALDGLVFQMYQTVQDPSQL